MTTIRALNAVLAPLLSVLASSLFGADLTVPADGRVTVEFLSSSTGFRDTLSVTSPSIGVATNGCRLEPAGGLGGIHLLSEKPSQHGCRVELDADPATPGIQPFPAGSVLRFGFCGQAGAGPDCTYIWSSNPADNPDGRDHVQITPVSTHAFRMSWEDLPDLGDADFNDLIVVVRVTIDSDGDGLWDDWEQVGIDTDGDGVVDVDLPAMGADPYHKDVFVQLDYMDCAAPGGDCPPGDNHTHRPLQPAIDAVIQGFANAPVANPDGTSGIRLHVDVRNAIPHQMLLNIPGLCFPGGPDIGNFDLVKATYFGTGNPLRFVSRYGMFTHRQAADTSSSGCAEMPGNDFQVSLGGWNVGWGDVDGDGIADDDVGTVSQQAGTFMHELGHNLALRHGGDDDVNYKPNYLSVMNYLFQVDGIPPEDPDGPGPLYGRFDYSRAPLLTLDENNLSEPAGIGAGTDDTFYFCPAMFLTIGRGTGPINWNCNRSSIEPAVAADINLDRMCVGPGEDFLLNTVPAGDDVVAFKTYIANGTNGICETVAAGDDQQLAPPGKVEPKLLRGYDDWPALKFDFQNTHDFEDGQHTPAPERGELTFEEYMRRLAADLVVAKTASPEVVLADTNVTYTIELANRGVPPARNIVLSDALPSATAFVSCSATAGGVCAGTGNSRTVSFPSLRGGSTATVSLVAHASCAIPDGTGISNAADVATPSPERDFSNNAAEAGITVVNPPPAIGTMSAKPGILWPPNRKMVDVTIDYQATGNCGPMSCALKVRSNDDDDDDDDDRDCRHDKDRRGHKDRDDDREGRDCKRGHKHEPDWIVVDAHHVKLRAERAERNKDRLYTVTATCSNSTGASAEKKVVVKVPRRKPK